MNTTVKYYRQLLSQTPGSDISKIKTLLANQMDSWYLIDADLMIDLLDDKNIDAADLLEALKSIAEFDSENTAFKNAVLAIDFTLNEKNRHKVIQVETMETLSDEEIHGNDSVMAFYSQLGFDDNMRLAS